MQTDAPAAVEITVFRQDEEKRLIIHLLNFQDQLPNIPVHGIELKIRMEGRSAAKVIQLPDGEVLPHVQENDQVAFKVPLLETYAMIAVAYE